MSSKGPSGPWREGAGEGGIERVGVLGEGGRERVGDPRGDKRALIRSAFKSSSTEPYKVLIKFL